MKLSSLVSLAFLPTLATAQGIQLLDVVDGPGSSTYFGETFADIGDCDGDGVPDIVVGMRRGNALRIVSGQDRSVILDRHPVIPDPPGSGGLYVASAGDFDGDGRGDALVGFAAS